MAIVKDALRSLQASGSVGGITYSDYHGTGVVREKPIPTQPNSPRQVFVRTVLTFISRYWANTLTEGIRKAWSQFADIFIWTNIFGNQLRLSGINLFAKMNFQLRDFGKALQTTPPPAINPDEIVFTFQDFDIGEPDIIVEAITLAQAQAQEVFVDIWAVGYVVSAVIDDTDADQTIVTITTEGLPQGINPVKSDYRHTIYVNQNTAQVVTPTLTKSIHIKFVGAVIPYANPIRIASIVRRYNKYGRYSNIIKVSEVSPTI